MDNESVSFAKQQIHFFMEKSFQIPLGYGGALVALGAVGRPDVLSRLSSSLDISVPTIVCGVVLALNLTYLTIATACLFAILKRGYFVLLQSIGSSANCASEDSSWEVFVRSPGHQRFGGRLWVLFGWNVDNYYMLPLFAFIAASSICAFVFAWGRETSAVPQGVLIVLLILHVVPGWAFVAMFKLNRAMSRRIIQAGRDRKSEKGNKSSYCLP
jgi:hypothetical protein